MNLRMARHAGLGRGNIGMGGRFSTAMRIPAIQRQPLHVDRMGKRNRLGGYVAKAGVFRREVIPDPSRDSRSHHVNAYPNVERDPVGPLWEKVGHGSQP